MNPTTNALLAAAWFCLAGTVSAQTGAWTATRNLEGPFAAGSIPEPPLVAMNAEGRALLAWNATGIVRWAEHVKGGGWLPRGNVPGGGSGAGPVALALGNSGAAAVAYTTVATRYTPSRLMVSVRPAAGSFGAAVEPAPGSVAGAIKLGIACDGSVTLLWGDASALWASTLAGTGRSPGACDGQPGAGPWSAPVQLSNAHVGAALPGLVVNDAGAALAVWQQGAPGNPSAIVAAYRPAGGSWEPAQTASAPTARATWNPKAGLDATGAAAIGYLDGQGMVVVARTPAGAWSAPALVSGSQAAAYPAFAMSAAGDMLVAWLAQDPLTGSSEIWARVAASGAGWSAARRLSALSDQAGWPSAAFAGDGSVAIVGWTDDAANVAKASVYAAGTWTRRNLGTGYWGGPMPVAAGAAAAVAGWAMPNLANPNAAKLVARAWE
ncbi:hypothetical protein [Piscinibacter defluvii]|uniref:hypothetical protein n=1 Tax=Piscinibacter defluvii TaxID=1796922 RepID=UPI000FDEE99B|nr:hypothetical protein [Piscinibacter defluvii]